MRWVIADKASGSSFDSWPGTTYFDHWNFSVKMPHSLLYNLFHTKHVRICTSPACPEVCLQVTATPLENNENWQNQSYQELLFFKNKPIKKDLPPIRHTWYFSFSSFPAVHQPHGLEQLEEALPICKSSAEARAAVRGEWLPAAQRTYQLCRKAVVVPLSLSDSMMLCDKSWGILVRIALRSPFALITLKIRVQN